MRFWTPRALITFCLAVYALDIGLPVTAWAGPSCAQILTDSSSKGDPKLLKETELRLSLFLSRHKEKVPSHVYRGLALPDYSPVEMVRFLFGDWRYVISSHDFKRAFDLHLSKGDSAEMAAQKASIEVTTQAMKDISKMGPSSFADQQALETYIGTKVENKRASAMAAMPEDPLQSENPNSPFFYAKAGYANLVKSKPDVGIFVLEIDQSQKTGVMTSGKHYTSDKEYYLISHIPPTSINRFFVGFSSHWNIPADHVTRETLDEKIVWFAFSISRRDVKGRPLGFEIHPMHSSFEDLTPGQYWLQIGVEQFSIEEQSGWNSDEPNDKASRSFQRKFPILEPSLRQILKSLEQ